MRTAVTIIRTNFPSPISSWLLVSIFVRNYDVKFCLTKIFRMEMLLSFIISIKFVPRISILRNPVKEMV